MRMALLCGILFASLLLCPGRWLLSGEKPNEQPIAHSATEVKPLDVGETVPDITLKTAEGKPFPLSTAFENGTTVLVFYRGSWCPFCNKHTAALIKVFPRLKDQNIQLIALSPDKPEVVAETVKSADIPFTVLSDQDLTAAKAFGLAFQVDEQTQERYKGFGIDLEKASGRDHHSLPVPAVYIVDRDGKVLYRDYNADYKERLSPEVIERELGKLVGPRE